ncbi:MAG: AMP-binding protein [Steroidobacteraceae bacterium]
MTTQADRSRYRSDGWWSDTRITDLFDAAVQARPSATAVVDPPNREALIGGEPLRLSFTALARRVEGYALRLLELGLRRGDILVTQLPNVAEYVATYLAAMRLGVVVSPVPMQFRAFELQQIIGLTRARAVLTVPQFKGAPFGAEARAAAAAGGALPLQLGAVDGSHAQEFLPTEVGVADAERLRARLRTEPVDAHDLATICWTSGTEGMPKGVPRTHDHWLAISHAHLRAWASGRTRPCSIRSRW